MKRKIIAGLVVLAIFCFGLYILTGKRFQKTSIFQNGSQKNENIVNGEISSEESSLSTDENKNIRTDVKSSDCDNECKRFEDNDDELDYCQQICGFSEEYEQDYENAEGEVDDASCQKQTGLKKDYCLKDLAISQDDSKICEQISDTNIQKTCRNRLMEDLLEEQSNPPSEDY